MQPSRLLPSAAATVFLASIFITTGSAGDKKEAPAFPGLKLGAEHKLLEGLVGTFDAKVKMFLDPGKPPVESGGVMTRKLILGGNYLQESYEGKFFGKPFNGLGILGYDTLKKKFVSTWCDSMSTSISVMEGTFDLDKKTLIGLGEDIDPNTKKKMKARDLLKIVSGDEQFFEMFRQPEGVAAEVKIMEITYTRRKQ